MFVRWNIKIPNWESAKKSKALNFAPKIRTKLLFSLLFVNSSTRILYRVPRCPMTQLLDKLKTSWKSCMDQFVDFTQT